MEKKELFLIVLAAFLAFIFNVIISIRTENGRKCHEFYEKNRKYVNFNQYESMITFNSNPPLFLRRKAKILKGYAELKNKAEEQKKLPQCDEWKCSPNNCSRAQRKNCFREHHVRYILQT
ncbi:MAG: hypothetical protein JEZ14_08210 [Marinilabiliaceae bacterium]|nr:hypothetical protein [Marinilabiliaceae bacterium]